MTNVPAAQAKNTRTVAGNNFSTHKKAAVMQTAAFLYLPHFPFSEVLRDPIRRFRTFPLFPSPGISSKILVAVKSANVVCCRFPERIPAFSWMKSV